MKDILSPRNRVHLAEFAQSDSVLIAFDFDGTLAPIVERPDRARLRPRTRRLLKQVAAKFPCAVISGRAYPDLLKRVDGLAIPHLIGNHGIEGKASTPALRSTERQVRRWFSVLSKELYAIDGLELENKKVTLSIHYRRVRKNRKLALEQIASSIRRLKGARQVGGKEVINLLPTGKGDKGSALLALKRGLGCERAIFFGDDVTDEDVFRLRDSELLCVRIGRSRESKADWFVREQRDIDSLLEQLLRVRRYRDGSRD